ncbi:MAG: DUF4399 domain-containing protein [Stenotrophobium sp.]
MRKIISLTTLLLGLALIVSTAQADDTMNMLKDAAKAQANTKLETTLNLAQTAPADAKVYIIEPKDGAVVKSPFKVVFGLSGMGVAPAGTQVANTGHHHLLIDNPQVDMSKPLPATDQIKHFGKGQTETTLTLAPGQHTLQLLFADWKHQSFNPPVESEKITITVK